MNWNSSLLEGMFRATGGVVASFKGATTYGHLDLVTVEDALKYEVKVNGSAKTFSFATGLLPGVEKEKDWATNPLVIEGTRYKVLTPWLEDDGKTTKLHLQKL